MRVVSSMRVLSFFAVSILLLAAGSLVGLASTPAEVVPVEVAQSPGAIINARAFRENGAVRLVCRIDYRSGGHFTGKTLRITLKEADGKILLNKVKRLPRREREPNGKLDDSVTLRSTFGVDPFAVATITLEWD